MYVLLFIYILQQQKSIYFYNFFCIFRRHFINFNRNLFIQIYLETFLNTISKTNLIKLNM